MNNYHGWKSCYSKINKHSDATRIIEVIIILQRKYVLIFSVLILIFLMGSASAANTTNVKHSTNQSIVNQHSKLVQTNHYNTTSNIKGKSTKNQIVPGYGCCSVLVHVKKGYDVFSFRRDSVYTSTLYLKKTTWYGNNALQEYKTTNGNFFHTIISKNGWIFGSGGPDIPSLNRQLMELAGRTSVSGHITSRTISSATSVLRKMGMGHFLIKAPDDYVGVVSYNGGELKDCII